ncbi:hypothetical protein [Methylibium sp.]|uniref:hypothetical protein n=1 Tax=Methylibium sp. TaxID=2067992 RepID=UPI003D099015
MTRTSLQAITWGTVSAAVVSAMLLAAAGDETADWRFEPPGAGVRQAPALRPAAGPEHAPRRHAAPPHDRSSHETTRR